MTLSLGRFGYWARQIAARLSWSDAGWFDKRSDYEACGAKPDHVFQHLRQRKAARKFVPIPVRHIHSNAGE
jgi:hypothetical protein